MFLQPEKRFFCGHSVCSFSFGTMASADFLQFVVTTDFFVCKTSPGKRYHFHLIYLLHLRLEFRAVSDFVLSCKLVHFKTPFMQFLLPCL